MKSFGHQDSSPHCSCATSAIISSLWKVTFHKTHSTFLFWAETTSLLCPSSVQIQCLLYKGTPDTVQIILTPSWRMFVFCEQSSTEHHIPLQKKLKREGISWQDREEKVLLKKISKCLNLKLKFHCNCTVTPQPGELWVSQLPCPTSVSPGRSINTGEEQVILGYPGHDHA